MVAVMVAVAVVVVVAVAVGGGCVRACGTRRWWQGEGR